MVLVDARGLPVSVDTTSASPHESQLVQRLFDFMLTDETPERLIGDKIQRIKMPGYEVGSRETLFANLAKRSRPSRSNKASQTTISENQSGTGRFGKKKKARTNINKEK